MILIQLYLLYFDIEDMKVKADVVKLSNSPNEKLEEGINGLLNSTGYDFYDYSDDIAILVDDQGFFKPGNPVFEIVNNYGERSRLAGRLLFVRNIENEFSVDIGSIKFVDIFKLRTELEIKLVGMTRI